MSLRIDTTEWIAGSLVIGDVGLGVLGSEIPSTGDHGAGYAYNDLDLPTDANKEICGRITTWPSAGTLFAYEDTSFEFSGPDGTYSFQYQLYVDGVATGSPVTVTLQVGVLTHSASGSLASGSATVAGTAARTHVHSALGDLLAGSSAVSGSADRIVAGAPHTSLGSLQANSATVSGIAALLRTHSASGALSAEAATVIGVAHRSVVGAVHTATGELLAGAAVVIGGAYNGALFTQEQLDFLLAYMDANLMIPTPEEIAQAVLAAIRVDFTADPPPVDVTKVNHVTLQGSGIPADPMRPA